MDDPFGMDIKNEKGGEIQYFFANSLRMIFNIVYKYNFKNI